MHLSGPWQHFREFEGVLSYLGCIFTCLLMFQEKPCWLFCMVKHNPGLFIPGLIRQMRIHAVWMLCFLAMCCTALSSQYLLAVRKLDKLQVAYLFGEQRKGKKLNSQTRNLRANKLGKFLRKMQQQHFFFFSEKCFQERMRVYQYSILEQSTMKNAVWKLCPQL